MYFYLYLAQGSLALAVVILALKVRSLSKRLELFKNDFCELVRLVNHAKLTQDQLKDVIKNQGKEFQDYRKTHP